MIYFGNMAFYNNQSLRLSIERDERIIFIFLFSLMFLHLSMTKENRLMVRERSVRY